MLPKASKKPPKSLRDPPKTPQDAPKTSPEPLLGPPCNHLVAMLGSLLASWWPSWLFLGHLGDILSSHVASWLDFDSMLARFEFKIGSISTSPSP